MLSGGIEKARRDETERDGSSATGVDIPEGVEARLDYVFDERVRKARERGGYADHARLQFRGHCSNGAYAATM